MPKLPRQLPSSELAIFRSVASAASKPDMDPEEMGAEDIDAIMSGIWSSLARRGPVERESAQDLVLDLARLLFHVVDGRDAIVLACWSLAVSAERQSTVRRALDLAGRARDLPAGDLSEADAAVIAAAAKKALRGRPATRIWDLIDRGL